MKFVMIVILIALAGMMVIWYDGHRQVEEWYDNVARWNKEHAAEIVKPRPSIDATKMISVASPHVGAIVGHTFAVEGQARGAWYAEGIFPLEIQNESGVVMQSFSVHALGDSHQPDFIPFSIDIAMPYFSGPAQIVLKKANLSGLPENDASITIPIKIQ